MSSNPASKTAPLRGTRPLERNGQHHGQHAAHDRDRTAIPAAARQATLHQDTFDRGRSWPGARWSALTAPLPAASAAARSALPKPAPQPRALGYTTQYDHPVAELATQLGVDLQALMAANGWTDPNQVIAAGTAIRVPDTATSRATIQALTGSPALLAPAGTPANTSTGTQAPANSPSIQPGGPAPVVQATGGQAAVTPAPASAPAATGAGGAVDGSDVPYINQRNPDGADQIAYSNGAANCGPTSLAMVFKAFGLDTNESDAQLVMDLGQKLGTTGDGTSPDAIVSYVNDSGTGLHAEEINGQGGTDQDIDWIKSQIQAGKKVILNGSFYPMHGFGDTVNGHFMVIAGVTKDGNFILSDPDYDPEARGTQDDTGRHQTIVTPDQVKASLADHGGDGGWLIAIGPEGGARATTAASGSGTPAPMAAGGSPAIVPAVGTNPSQQQFDSLLTAAAEAHGVPPALLKAVAYQESGWTQYTSDGSPVPNHNTNGTTDWGLMQINDGAWPQQAERAKTDPAYAADFAATLLSQLHDQYGSWDQAVAAYNLGHVAYNADGTFANQDYVSAVDGYEATFAAGGNPTSP